MTRERALEKAIHLSKTTHSICVDSESFWENVIVALSAEPCEDAISRQEAIRAIEALQRPIMREESNYYQFKFSGMSEAREAVENLPSVSPQQKVEKWIPVNERLPEKGGDYLVTQKTSFSDYVYESVASYALNLHDVDEYDFADKKRPGWHEYDPEWGYRELDDVVAWMPLPDPYKAESEDKI